jgi:cystathionine gamma-synthase
LVNFMKFDSILVHAGLEPDPTTKAVAPGFAPSTIFEFPEGGFQNTRFGYARYDNPSRHSLETALATLEDGAEAAAFGSGMAAIQAVIQALGQGARVIAPTDVYHGTRNLMNDFVQYWGLHVDYVNMTDLACVAEAISAETRLVWLETPSNPMLHITDVEAVCNIARAKGVPVCVDNTWPSPMLQQPLKMGADLVMHSTTKYLGGHSDILGGAVVGGHGSVLFERVRRIQQLAGAVPSPFDCWLLLRSMRTLGVRVRQQCQNAEVIAGWLSEHPLVETVFYPGLKSHPGHSIAASQMKHFGAMLSFTLRLPPEKALKVVCNSQMIVHATSLGSVESLWEHRRSSEGPESKTPDTLIRLSVGIEDVDDIISDIDASIKAVV